MALDLGTIITAVEAVQKAIEMCKRVEDLPDQMKTLGRRMELQNTVLLQVETFIKEYSKGVDPILEAGQQQDLVRIIGNVKENADKVYELFEREKENILSREYNLQFKFKLPARIWFALVENQPEKIKGIMEDINHDREELSHYLQIIGLRIGAQNLIKTRELENKKKELAKAQARVKLLEEAKAKEKDKQKEKEKIKSKETKNDKPKEKDKQNTKENDRDKSPGPSKQNQQPSPLPPSSPSKALELVVPVQNNAKKRRLSPSPSPLPLRQDYKILFVDPRNQARSLVAQSIVLLLGGLTEATSNSSSVPWRIAKAHSAGFFVSHKSTLTSVISSLSYSYKSYKMGPFPGNELPNPVALASVFDNKSYPYPFKSTIQTRMTKHRSVGLTEDAFKTYDYIIVFTNREHDNMVRLKDALIQSGKISAREKGGKGRVLHLGTYIPQRNGKPKEILNVPSKLDEATGKRSESRGDWNKKAGEIKTALKAFLKDEMGWVMPCSSNMTTSSQGLAQG